MKSFFVSFCKSVIVPLTKFFIQEIEGEENLLTTGPFILAPNHLSGWDHCFVGTILERRIKDISFVGAMDSLRTILFSGLLYYLSDTIIINRNQVRRKKALKEMKKCLKEGKIIVIYPEGDTNRKRRLLRGKTGAVELSLETNTPIIPMGMKKKRKSWKRIIKVGKPLYFKKEREKLAQARRDKKSSYHLLRKATQKLMRKISFLSQKPYSYEN